MSLLKLKKLTFGMLFILSHEVCSQATLDMVEDYIFEPIFDLCINSEINEIIEKDKDSKISRKWLFNENGLLSKEIDLRENGLYSEMGNQTFSSSINYKEYIYHYNTDDKIAKVVLSMVQDIDTSQTVRIFDYISDDLFKEKFILPKQGVIQKERFQNTYSSKGLKDSIVFTSISRSKNFVSEWKTKTVFYYNKENKIKKEERYFKSNSYPLQNGQITMSYQLSSVINYGYDNKGRIHNITDYHYDESGDSKINQRTIFQYSGSTSRLINLIIPIMNSESQENLKLSLYYNGEKCLKRIDSEYGSVYYEYTDRK